MQTEVTIDWKLVDCPAARENNVKSFEINISKENWIFDYRSFLKP